MQRIAMLSPLPPARTGVAHYAAMILPALRRTMHVDAFDAKPHAILSAYDGVIYQLGNNPHHDFVYAQAMKTPGVVVLHDVVLHHLIVEMTLARGDAESYIEVLRANHGEVGAAWATARAAGLHSEMGNFLLPASVDLARRSRAVIVHNRWAADVLRSFAVDTPIHVVPHPVAESAPDGDRDAVRERLGIDKGSRVIGLFGFLTSAKRAEVVVEAFRRARARDPRLLLLIVGEPAPNIDMSTVSGSGVVTTGYVADEDFGAYYAAADRLVNLRYPSAGETSGTLVRAFAAGRPVAVSDYAQFSEYPDDCVVKIPFGASEVEKLAEFFVGEIDDRAVAKAQRAWLAKNARMDDTIKGYERALASNGAPPPSAAIFGGPVLRGFSAPLDLFPSLELVQSERDGQSLRLTLRNTGDHAIRARVYGQPGYRGIAKQFDGGTELTSEWLGLTGDVAPGQSTILDVTINENADRLELHHALQGVAAVRSTPAVVVGLTRVR
jgi:glycosyltransferase involved in cell wall biosynthesis